MKWNATPDRSKPATHMHIFVKHEESNHKLQQQAENSVTTEGPFKSGADPPQEEFKYLSFGYTEAVSKHPNTSRRVLIWWSTYSPSRATDRAMAWWLYSTPSGECLDFPWVIETMRSI
jgi:steroid 5-alpha reductase family enzyme